MFKGYKKVIKLSVTLIYILMCNQVSLRPLMIAVLYMKLVWFQIYIDTFKKKTHMSIFSGSTDW